MLLKLNRQSTKTYIRMNDNPDLPSRASSTIRNNLITMGFGYTKYGHSMSYPDYLQEVSLSYVPNYVCERSKDPKAGDTYQGLIADDMLCASDMGEDACQGEIK
jgi:secreted trypsin-like serine protease